MGVQEAAAALIGAWDSGVPCPPIRSLLDDRFAEAQAYAVQEKLTKRWLSQGRRLVGRKIGLTSRAVQVQLGVQQPDYGALFADVVLCAGEPIQPGRVLQPRVEAEVALVLDRDLAMECPTVADVIRAVGFALPAIEVVGSRIAGWDIALADTVADNASAGLVVLGGPPRSLIGLDLAACRMEMRTDGAVSAIGSGADCLGSPLNAAVWLARRMTSLGSPLRAGDLVMTGALGPMAPAEPGMRISAQIEGVGKVEAMFASAAASGSKAGADTGRTGPDGA